MKEAEKKLDRTRLCHFCLLGVRSIKRWAFGKGDKKTNRHFIIYSRIWIFSWGM